MKKKVIIAVITLSLILSGAPIMEKTAEASSTAQVVKGVNFRTQPATSSSVIRMLRTGEQVTVIEQVNSYWYKVRDRNNRVGYVSSSSNYLRLASTGTAEIIRGVNFRTGPSTNSGRIRMLNRGEQVTILKRENSHWYQVRDRNGRVGYVSSSSQYIRTGGSSGSSSSNSSSNATRNAQRVIDAGMKYMGTPYQFGASRSSTRVFDCSSFVRRAFMDGLGITLPSNSRTQADYVKKIGKTSTNWRNLKPGDIMFFMSYKGTSRGSYNGINKSSQRITHNAIYLGNGRMLHTYSNDSGGVRIDNIGNNHWEYRFVFGGTAF